MANSIVDSITSLVGSQFTNSLASRLGIPADSVQSGLSASVTAMISGIANRSNEPGFMAKLFDLIRGSDLKTTFVNLPGLVSGATASLPISEEGSKLVSLIFGDHQSTIVGAIGQQSGVGAYAGNWLVQFAAPLLAGFLGQQILDKRLNVSSFSQLIDSEAAKLQSMLPGGGGSLLSSLPTTTSAFITPPGPKSAGFKPLYLLLVLAALAIVVWLLVHGCNSSTPPRSTTSPSAPQTAPVAAPAPGPLGEFIKRKLPDGTELTIPRLGIENKLIDFIEDDSKQVDKTTWFDFDRLTFDTGRASLQPSSAEQLGNIAAILKAYSKVKAKIGGYTDNIGNKQANLKLSQDRATNVTHDLIGRGIDSSRLEAKGYGEEHPVAANSTEEGRQKNRRISLLVTAK